MNETSTGETIRVLIADDETLLRDAISQLLGLQPDIDVVATVENGEQALTQAQELDVDVAILDQQMPDITGTEVTTRLAKDNPDIRCVIVTSHPKPGSLKTALSAGAYGYLPKTVSGQQLADIIRQVAGGQRYVDPMLAAETIAAGNNPLTPREIELLQVAAKGRSIEEIASEVFLSAGTVRNYLSSAMQKLGVNNRHAAVAEARENGWID